jgi:hypothetical protein
MELQKDTLELILSMTMNEKRHFKIFNKKLNFESRSKHLLLFDLINKYEKIDEKLIKEYLFEHGYSINNISYDINYLHKLLLKSLNDFHSEKTTSLKIKENLKSVEILFYKGLYEQSLKLIEKTKKICAKNENLALMIELLNWEKKCSGYSYGLQAAKLVNENITIHIDKITKNKIISDLYYRSYILKNASVKDSNEKVHAEMDALINSEEFRSIDVNGSSFVVQIFYNLIFANYYHVIKDKKQELKFLEKAIEITNENEFYKKENPLNYTSIFIRIIDIYKKTSDTVFYKKIEELRGFENSLDFQKEVLAERIFVHSNQAELDFLIFNNEIEKARNKMYDLIKNLDENKFNIEPYYYIAIYYQFAAVYLLDDVYSKSLKYVNKILNENKMVDRPNTYIKTEILNIIVHFKLGNYTLVFHCLDNFKKKYSKRYKLSYIEMHLLRVIFYIADNQHTVNIKNEFRKLAEKVKPHNNEDINVSDKILFYFILRQNQSLKVN